MADDPTARERALRTLPLPYSLALRLRDAGVAPDAISEYLDVDLAGLAGLYRVAEAKLAAAQRVIDRRDENTPAPTHGVRRGNAKLQ
ncbi:MAG: hypothetical protein QJR12_04675 [Mycobacterium sp.]|uniref:hypothetical protein n=1 Tax=Mycobacterium sp. TaxID=1785 RepID=UPI0026110A90|nr:hypothetical protein [Mycobacterium sp.]MDI3313591.1 hypothetical protein [Mycobacterium sp.]